MGQSLAARYANDFVTFGFAFSTGKYRVGLKIHEAIPPPAGSVEEVLQRTGLPSFMLDLRRIPRDSRATRWATEPRPFRAVGPVATEDQFFPTVVGDEYDALVYFDRTTPTVLGPN
jgi:erythromycin esterase-like protein